MSRSARHLAGPVTAAVMMNRAEAALRAEMAAAGHDPVLLLTFSAVREAPAGQLVTSAARLPGGAPEHMTPSGRRALAAEMRNVADVLDPPDVVA